MGGRDSSPNFGRAFAFGIGLNVAYVAAEAAFGILADSVALLADAAHNLSDVLALFLAWGAGFLSRRAPSGRYTYGLRSSSILAALVNAALLLMMTGAIAWEAVERLGAPAPVEAPVVIAVAGAGIVVNGATALLFLKGQRRDLNLRAAFLHMVADAAVSAGVVAAGIGIIATGWLWLDPAASLLISAVIVAATWRLLRESLDLALHAVPASLDPGAVRAFLAALPGVAEVHDLHIWGMSTTETALTCHLVMPEGHPGDAALARAARELEQRFGIHHATLQVETGDREHGCTLAPEHVV